MELGDAVVEVDRLLKQWREIVRVIPSLDHRPLLLETLVVEQIVVDRDRWALLAGIDGRRTVRELVQRAGRPVLDVCHTVLELVEAGAVGVLEPAASPAAAPVASPPPTAPARARAAGSRTARPPRLRPAPAPSPAPRPGRRAAARRRPPSRRLPPRPPRLRRLPHRTAPVASPSPPNRNPPNPSRPPTRNRSEPEPAEPKRVTSGDDGAEAPDKGAFLRLFSGLRDS